VLDVASALSTTGTNALSMTGDGWAVASMLFDSVLLSEAGPDFYQAYLTGQLAPDAPEVEVALADLAKLVDSANSDLAKVSWLDAVHRLCNGESAMIMMPDFVKAELASVGCLDSATIGYVPLEPAGAPTFDFVGTGFALAQEARDPANGTEFLRTVGSREGQESFNSVEGTVPARIDADLSGLDFVSIAEAMDYRAASERLVLGYACLAPVGFQESVNAALGQFVDRASPDYKNVNAVLVALRSNYVLLER
jgi:glucose/mannose transport system substrate-binding protein